MKKQKRRNLNPNTVLVIRQILIGVLIFGFLGLFISTIWYGSRISMLTIDSVEVTGGETIPHEVIRKIVEQKLEGKYLGIVPRRFSPLYPRTEIETTITDIERIKSVTLERDGGKKIYATFTEYVPTALWCAKESEACTFLDETGYSFGMAPNLTGGTFLRLHKIGIDPFLDTQAFATDSFLRIQELIAELATADWFISVVEIDAANDMYLQVVEGGELKVSLNDEPSRIVDNFLTVLTSPEFIDIAPGTFEYIDLRFGNKVFISKEPIEETASSTEDSGVGQSEEIE